jgi:beta-mannosidase
MQYDGRPYITTSPQIGWGRNESMTHGDSHYWGVWWGLQPIETYTTKVPRFMSEYGMQSMPNFESVKQFSSPQDWDTSSMVMKLHQKHLTGFKNLAVYLNQVSNTSKVSDTFSIRQYIDATQELQSRALETAIIAHMNAQPRCMGTLFWQFNDCYPGITWSVIDYYGRKKKAYYTVKRLYIGK